MPRCLKLRYDLFSKINHRDPQEDQLKQFMGYVNKYCVPEQDFVLKRISSLDLTGDPYRTHRNPMEFEITAAYGDVRSKDFDPAFTPKEMLAMGVFEGRYLNSLFSVFPIEWWKHAKISLHVANPALNFYKVKSRQTLQAWKINHFLRPEDPRGFFEWYCYYFLGRRVSGYDEWQMARWKAFVRHQAGLVYDLERCLENEKTARFNDPKLFPVRRQALLQWSWPQPKH